MQAGLGIAWSSFSATRRTCPEDNESKLAVGNRRYCPRNCPIMNVLDSRNRRLSVALALMLVLGGCAQKGELASQNSNLPQPQNRVLLGTEQSPQSSPKRRTAMADENKVAAVGVGSLDQPTPEEAQVRSTELHGKTSAKGKTRSVRDTRMVKLFFATDRKWSGSGESPKWFSPVWSQGDLTYGTCQVSIPVNHEAGKIEGVSIFEWRREDIQKDVVIHLPIRLAKDPYFQALRAAVQAAPDKEVVVFIHGFNNTFEDAGKRLGVLCYDMDFNGVPVLYSWSSRGGTMGILAYARDESMVEKTKRPLADFLTDVVTAARAGGATRVNVAAHSMGNRALVGALQRLAENGPEGRLIDEVVMAAPDVMAEGFEATEWRYLRRPDGKPGPVGRFTLYASDDDKALTTSKLLHGGTRLGQAGAELVVLPGLETIDATGVDFSELDLNHSYFGGRRVTRDLRALFAKGATPVERHLEERKRPPLAFWLLPSLEKLPPTTP